MHPFGGTQICPRCSKAVYAAEQVMGPGRKLYHKPCLACTICSKRLDSYTLLEHDEKPYCKACHVKNFGTRDLRQANLPHREITPDTDGSRSTSPLRNTLLTTPPRLTTPLRTSSTNGTSNESAPRRAALAASPVSSSFPNDVTMSEDVEIDSANPENNDDAPTTPPRHSPDPTPALVATPSNTGRHGAGGIPRTVPLTPVRSGTYGAYSSPAQGRHGPNNSIGGTPIQDPEGSIDGVPAMKPILQTTTGTRYGSALTSNLTGNAGSPRRWGASTNPSCPRCGKSVYFAEQVKAVGKTYHKNCLRCTECNTLLDSSRLRDHDGEPLCVRCYGKLHGPQGGGYALLGKAGG